MKSRDLILGVSTGGPYRQQRSLQKVLKAVAHAGYNAVELSRAVFEIPMLHAEDLSPFSYVSLHAPVLPYGKNAATEKAFRVIETLYAVRPLDCVVFHPDSVEDFSVFRDTLFPVAFENMDWRKASHRDVRDMQQVMNHDSRFRFVFDVNHAYTNDTTLALGRKFYDALTSRLAQIHLSGFTTIHDPLFQTQQDFLIDLIQNFSVPIILEGVGGIEELQPERDYVLQKIENILAAR